MTKRQNYPCFF